MPQRVPWWLFPTETFLGPRCRATRHWRLRAFRKGGMSQRVPWCHFCTETYLGRENAVYCNVPKVALFHRNLSGPPLPGHLTLAFACFPKWGDVPKGSMVTLFHRNLSGPRKRCVLQRPKGFHGGSFPQEPFWAPVARPSHTGVCVLSEKGGGAAPRGM